MQLQLEKQAATGADQRERLEGDEIGNRLVSLGGGLRYRVDGPTSGPESPGIGLKLALLLPKQTVGRAGV